MSFEEEYPGLNKIRDFVLKYRDDADATETMVMDWYNAPESFFEPEDREAVATVTFKKIQHNRFTSQIAMTHGSIERLQYIQSKFAMEFHMYHKELRNVTLMSMDNMITTNRHKMPVNVHYNYTSKLKQFVKKSKVLTKLYEATEITEEQKQNFSKQLEDMDVELLAMHDELENNFVKNGETTTDQQSSSGTQ